MQNVNQSSPKPIGLREKIERFIDEALGPVWANIAGLTEQLRQMEETRKKQAFIIQQQREELATAKDQYEDVNNQRAQWQTAATLWKEKTEEYHKTIQHQNDLLRGAIEQHNDNDGMTRDEVVERQKQERLDMFAAAALSGSIAADGGQNFESEAKMAYSYAEAMEEERAKRLKT